VDFYSGILYDCMGIPRELFTPIFAVSRVAGWCAHWLEQIPGNKIFRPRQVYLGTHREPYVPMEQRG
jgi:citrate synthase